MLLVLDWISPFCGEIQTVQLTVVETLFGFGFGFGLVWFGGGWFHVYLHGVIFFVIRPSGGLGGKDFKVGSLQLMKCALVRQGKTLIL